MQIDQRQVEDVVVVALSGRFDAQSAGEVEENIKTSTEGSSQNLLVNMAGVEYVSSAGLRVLLATAKRLGAQGGKLVLCGLASYVWEVFEVAGFTTIFQILPDEEAGLKSF